MTAKHATHGQVIAAMAIGSTVTLAKIAPSGSLQVRKQVTGSAMFYWRYSHGTQSARISIGLYDSTASPKSIQRTERGFSVSAAIREAQIQAQRHHDNKADGGYTNLVKTESERKLNAKLLKAAHQGQTLQKLLLDYCDYLEKLERRSHKDARSIFKVHVFEPWPKESQTPASDISTEQVADMMRRVHENGKARTSNKLRSYLRAAYQVAKSAKTKASIPVSFKAFRIANNPVSETEPDTTANKADKDPLSSDEMLVYWRCIKDIPSFKGAVLRLHVLTGGLRIEQLVKLKTKDIDKDSITLTDIKGRPGGGARLYTTPLTPLAKQALSTCNPVGIFAISTDSGETHLAATTLSRWACQAVGAKIEDFNAKRIRSGVETLLAKLKFSKDLRGHLQSHGISGVQSKHYDGHDYIDEKKDMLEVLQNTLVNGSL